MKKYGRYCQASRTGLFAITLAVLAGIARADVDPVCGVSREVTALAYYPAPDYEGVSRGVRLCVDRSHSGAFEMDITRQRKHGAGNRWVATSWVGAVIASLYTGVDPTTLKISVDVSGPVDGPSAGALMATAIASAIVGDALLPNRTMTGTITPDGTLGVVGGVPAKLEAAQHSGIDRVGLPDDQPGLHPVTGESIPETAHRTGIGLRWLADLDEAYTFLTGKPLGSRVSTPVSGFGAAFNQELAKRTDGVIKRAQSHLGELAALLKAVEELEGAPAIKNIPEVRDAARYFREATAACEQGIKARKAGELSGAYERGRLAEQLASWGVSNIQVQFILESTTVRTKGVDALYADVRRRHIALDRKIKDVLAAIPDRNPESAAELGGTVGALMALATAYMRLGLFEELVEPLWKEFNQAETQDYSKLVNELFVARGAQEEAMNNIHGLRGLLALAGTLGGTAPTVDQAKVAALAEFVSEAGFAAFNYFEKETLSRYPASMVENDITYGYARAAHKLTKSLVIDDWRSAEVKLASASVLFVYSLYLISQGDTILAWNKPKGWVGGIGDHRAFRRAFKHTKHKNQILMAELDSAGVDPDIPLFVNQWGNARYEYAVKDYERMEGLTLLWFSWIMAQLTRQFAGMGVSTDGNGAGQAGPVAE